MTTIITEIQRLKEQSAHCLQVASITGDTSGAAYHALMLKNIDKAHKGALILERSSLDESVSSTRSFFSPRV